MLSRSLGCLLLAVLASACVPKSVKESQTSMAAQLSLMDTRQAVMEKALEEREQELDQVQGTLRVIGRDSGDVISALERSTAQLRALRGEIETLQFQVDDLQKQVDDTSTQQEGRQLWDEARLRQVESSLGLKPPPKPDVMGDGSSDPDGSSETGGGQEPGEEAGEMPPTAKGKLERAVEEMRSGRQGVARFILKQIIEQHEGSDLVAEVRYRIGETYSNEANWGRAARAFQVVVDKHGRSEWASWSMLRQGEAFEAMDNPDGARIFYEDVRTNYPKSAAAKEAATKLSNL